MWKEIKDKTVEARIAKTERKRKRRKRSRERRKEEFRLKKKWK